MSVRPRTPPMRSNPVGIRMTARLPAGKERLISDAIQETDGFFYMNANDFIAGENSVDYLHPADHASNACVSAVRKWLRGEGDKKSAVWGLLICKGNPHT